MAKKAVDGLHDLVAMRVVIGHWPDADYIMRGIGVTYGHTVAEAVREILEGKRVEFEKELAQLERKHGAEAANGSMRESLTNCVTNGHDSRSGGLAGGQRGDKKSDSPRRPKGARNDRAKEVLDARRPARQA